MMFFSQNRMTIDRTSRSNSIEFMFFRSLNTLHVAPQSAPRNIGLLGENKHQFRFHILVFTINIKDLLGILYRILENGLSGKV